MSIAMREDLAAPADLAHTYDGHPYATAPTRPPLILSCLERHARTHGNRPYLTMVSADRVTTLSYRELDEQSRRLAFHLRHDLQVEQGDVAGLIPATDVPSVVALFGVLRAGCSLLVLNAADPGPRLRSQIEAAGARTILRSPAVPAEHVGEALAVPERWTSNGDRVVDAGPAEDPAARALLFGTSGSTAVSKIVAQSHANAAVNAHAVCRHHRLRRRDRILGCLPFHHVNGVHFTLLATLAAGAHAVVVESFDPFGYVELIRRVRPRLASVTPSLLEALLDAHDRAELPRDFRYFVSAAAPLTARTARAVATRFGRRIHQGYGLTETTNFSTTIPRDVTASAYRRLAREAEVPSIGTALYGNEVTVLRPDGSHAAPGETGELCMRGHNVMLGYVGNPGATAEAFRDGWFHSQDLGFAVIDRESGERWFVITGRIKNIAKVGGEAVSLEEMERTLRALPHVHDAACVARAHRVLGEEIVAAIVSPEEVRAQDLRAHLRRTFAPAALPRLVVRLSAIPRTPTGKIRRRELADQVTSLVGMPDDAPPSR